MSLIAGHPVCPPNLMMFVSAVGLMKNGCPCSGRSFVSIHVDSDQLIANQLFGIMRATNTYHAIFVGLQCRTRSHPEMVGDMSHVTLNFELSKIPFVHF